MTLRRVLAGAFLLAASAALASADSIIGYTTTYPVGGPPDPNTDFGFSLSLPEFNLAGQTLTGVKIILFAEENVSSVTLTNQGTASQSGFSATASSNIFTNNAAVGNPLFNSATGANTSGSLSLDLFSVSGVTLGGNSQPTCAPATPSASCSSVTYPATGTIEDDVNNDDQGFVQTTGYSGATGPIAPVTGVAINTGALGNYLGAGNFTLSGKTSGAVLLVGGGSVAGSVIGTGFINAEVDYTYTPTGAPEPGSMVLFGGGLVGLGLLGSRLRRA